MSDLMAWLTGGAVGVFSSLKAVITGCIDYIIRLVFNGISIFLSPICDWLFQNVPYIDSTYFDLTILNSILSYFNFILDATFISKPILSYAIGSVIFRLTYKIIFYNIKLCIAWYHMLMP